MAAPKGHRIPNAPKGRTGPNKLTRSVKEAFELVFKDMQAAADKPYSLMQWAQAEPTEFYKLAAKLIPSEIKSQVDVKVTPKVDCIIDAMREAEK
jgi:hypothetical protein